MVELVKLKAPIIVPHEVKENCLCIPMMPTWVVPVPQFSISDYGTELFKIAKKMLKYSPSQRPSAGRLEQHFRILPPVHPE